MRNHGLEIPRMLGQGVRPDTRWLFTGLATVVGVWWGGQVRGGTREGHGPSRLRRPRDSDTDSPWRRVLVDFPGSRWATGDREFGVRDRFRKVPVESAGSFGWYASIGERGKCHTSGKRISTSLSKPPFND
jgi:hypothetical protein